MHQFSDDTQAVPKLSNYAWRYLPITVLANCASSTTDWFTRNKVKPDSSKNLLLYTSSPLAATKIAPIPLPLGNTVIPPSDSVKNLSVILDSYLSMVAQISQVCKIGFVQLRMIGKIRLRNDWLTPWFCRTLTTPTPCSLSCRRSYLPDSNDYRILPPNWSSVPENLTMVSRSSAAYAGCLLN